MCFTREGHNVKYIYIYIYILYINSNVGGQKLSSLNYGVDATSLFPLGSDSTSNRLKGGPVYGGYKDRVGTLSS